MIDPSERKCEIDCKLEKEISNLILLKEKVDKSNHLTKGMVGILSSFEHRLARLEETILPVYNETGNLQRRQEHIERTLAALDHVIGFYGVSQEVEGVIRLGPGPISGGGAGLDVFLKTMNRLLAAQEYFSKNNPQSVELKNVSALYNSGGDALNREFKEILYRNSKPVPAIVLLDLVGNDDEGVGEDGGAISPSAAAATSLSRFPDGVAEELVQLADWLIMNGRDEFMNVYAKVRSTVLTRSLQALREQQRSSSGGSLQGVNALSSGSTVSPPSGTGAASSPSSGATPGSPVVRPKFQSRHETPSRRASRRLQHVFEKKANKMLLKASQTLEQSTGLTLGSRRSGMLLEVREDIVEDQEMENYLLLVVGLHRLMQVEHSLMAGIIPLQHHHKIFEIITRDALDTVVQDGENIAARAKRCINRHDFAAVLVVFPILKHLLAMKPEFDRTVEGCDKNVRSKFASILNTLHGTGAKALEDFIESVRGDASTALPKDGTVHELTSNSLTFLEQLLDFVETVGGILSRESQYISALQHLQQQVHPPLNTQADKNRALLGIYIRKVLVQLNLALVGKSELYGAGETCLRAIFRLNNSHYVITALSRSGLLSVVSLAQPDCLQSYLDMIKEHKRSYTQSWHRLISYICGADDVPAAVVQAGKLRDKDRNTIKEKFAGFNKEIEDIVKSQRGYSIPDVELREELKKENKDLIVPKYKAFFEKYCNVAFTKNLEKYIKYTPEQVADMINQLFDAAA
ncbi:exocyst complex component 7 [Ischnura elegans]|uniref:exocyst complex component 7 n=1 Tax=Ischnura elegans TaxID=197161 RepID=UPI001ED8A1A7|nr:exocyst complex component 7 [Ischnura elegans]